MKIQADVVNIEDKLPEVNTLVLFLVDGDVAWSVGILGETGVFVRYPEGGKGSSKQRQCRGPNPKTGQENLPRVAKWVYVRDVQSPA